MLNTDVLILGAGPGGAATALFLAKENIPCIVVDKAVFPRDKICGDALSGKVVEILNRYDRSFVEKLSLDPIQLNCWGVTFVAPNLEELSIPFRNKPKKTDEKREIAPGFITKRYDFDHFMVKEVKKHAGVNLMEGVEIDQFVKTPEGFTCSDKSGNYIIHAKLVIDGSGAHSQFAKKIGKLEVEKEHHCAGLRVYYKGVTGIKEGNYIELHFLKDFLPGYFWIFPLADGQCNVGVGMRSDYVGKKRINLKTELNNIIQKYPQLSERFKNAEPVDDIRGYGLPLGSKKRAISGDNYMLIGDAASLIDPFTGEGIGNAILSGYTAAQQAKEAIETKNFSGTALKKYDEAIYRRLGDELSLSYRMQKLVKYPWLFNFVVRKANRNKVLRETIMVMFEDIDIRDRLRKPSFYFKLLFSGKN
ncbi:MAG: NAD(P)/FAD-dependent oxidoreductase [Bacteroidetes bacterium]|nr:NAD(P)/FAD-dependent oxidoreductase [Bacteroidota bacterium]